MLRHTLSRYADVAPERWRFVKTESGRSELGAPYDGLGLRFSVSHTPGLVAWLVSHDVSGGVDVERTDRVADVSKPAAIVCSVAEREEMGRMAPDAARERFYDLWTLKEAYAKARGAGLRLPLHGVTFQTGDPVVASFDPALEDDPRDWQFALWRPSAEHQGAVAVRRGTRPEHTFVYRPVLASAIL